MVWVFRVVIYYIIVWVLTWVGIKLDNLKNDKRSYDNETILVRLTNGHIWWLIFPPVNIIAAIVFFIQGIVNFVTAININEFMTKFLFGKSKK